MNVFHVIQLSTATDEIDNHRKPILTMKNAKPVSSSRYSSKRSYRFRHETAFMWPSALHRYGTDDHSGK